MTSLADAPEAYDLYIFADEGFETVEFRTLLQFEAAFPAIVGCETLTIRSKFARQTSICVGGRGYAKLLAPMRRLSALGAGEREVRRLPGAPRRARLKCRLAA